MEFGEFKYNLDSLGLIISREAAVLTTLENSIAALENKVRANWVLSIVQTLIEAFLLG